MSPALTMRAAPALAMVLRTTLATAATLLLTIGPALAEPHAVQAKVNYADLDLQSPVGAAALYRRINSAARRVCDAGGSRDLRAQQAARRCRETAVARAVATIGSAQLAALHASRARHGHDG